MDFEEPINPVRAVYNAWDERVRQTPPLRFVGSTWDTILLILYCYSVLGLLPDPYGLGPGGEWEGVFFAVGGLAAWALYIGLFLRPVQRSAIRSS